MALKLKTSEVISMSQVLTSMANLEVSNASAGRRMMRNLQKLNKELECYNKALETLREPYLVKDDKGKAVPGESAGTVKLLPETAEEFHKRHKEELLDDELSLNLETVREDLLPKGISMFSLLVLEPILEDAPPEQTA